VREQRWIFLGMFGALAAIVRTTLRDAVVDPRCRLSHRGEGESARTWNARRRKVIPHLHLEPLPRLTEIDGGTTMADINLDELGPVDYLVVSFPAEKADFSGEMATALKELLDRKTIRLLDLVIVTKASDGTVEAAEVRDLDDSAAGQLRALESDLALLLGAEDAENVGASLEPGSAAAVLVWENMWAAPLGSAVRRSGGELVTSGRIPTQALIAAIEADRREAAQGA
jgi:hypothetical protein